MEFGLPLAAHLLSVAVWVGGMFFAYMALRPAAVQLLEPPHRLTLWDGVFARFFTWVWIAVVLVTASGLMMFFGQFGGFESSPDNIRAMFFVGAMMVLIFLYVFFVPYARLRHYVAAQDWPNAAKALARIRVLIAINLTLGLANIVIATAGESF
ncbi:MAG: CopD family protein [Pseudomonadota bacterium]